MCIDRIQTLMTINKNKEKGQFSQKLLIKIKNEKILRKKSSQFLFLLTSSAANNKFYESEYNLGTEISVGNAVWND